MPNGNRYAQIPPIYDQAVGVEIQRQMDEEGLTAQKVVGRAIAYVDQKAKEGKVANREGYEREMPGGRVVSEEGGT